MIVRNLTLDIILSDHAELADTFLGRMRGLLGRSTFAEGEAMVITHCNSIHMFFMKFPIDVIFLDQDFRVVGEERHIRPFMMSPVYWTSERVVELPAGTLERTGTSIGNIIEIK